jgi:hypothetical protein
MKVNFLIAGVQKGGTGSLNAYLRQHPQIGMAAKKEPHFFDHDALFSGDQPDYAAYHQNFEPRETIKSYGEATPIYTYWTPAMERIARYNSEMKLIVLLRDPAARAWSHWRMTRGRGVETASFSDAIRNEPRRANAASPRQHRTYSYVDRGRYGVQIRRMLGLFDRRQILFLKSEEFFRDAARELERVYEFLGVDPFRADTSRIHHVGPDCGSMPIADRAYLNETFRTDIEEVRGLLGWDCADWLA